MRKLLVLAAVSATAADRAIAFSDAAGITVEDAE